MITRLGPAALVAVLVAATALGCRVPLRYSVKPGHAPRCSGGVCFEIVSFESGKETVGAWIEAPPGTRLLNAHLLADETPPCGGEMTVAWVTIDQTTVRTGPVDVGGAHGLVLGFPLEAWLGHSGYWLAMFVDVELDVAGRTRCVRTRLTDAQGKTAVGQ